MGLKRSTDHYLNACLSANADNANIKCNSINLEHATLSTSLGDKKYVWGGGGGV